VQLSQYVELWRVSRQRRYSQDHYRAFQSLQARLLLIYLRRKGVNVTGATLLDLGSGVGGYGDEFARRGAHVISLDLVQPSAIIEANVARIRAAAEHIPLGRETVDLVFCASLIEHVPRPAVVLSEINRVLRVGGVAYVSFPPYYSPRGGHEFSPFHYLGERIALRLARRRLPRGWVRDLHGGPTRPTSFSGLFDGWGLYKVTLKRFRTLVAESGLNTRDSSTRYLPISFVRWPILGELLTWHAQFLLVKPTYAERRTNFMTLTPSKSSDHTQL
jgi:SAM-dependent methyltransferase